MSKNPTRMEMLGNLLTAMISIIVSGSSDLLAADPEPDPSTQYLDLPADILKKFGSRRVGPYYGMVSQIAREVGRSRAIVHKVLYGHAKSNLIVPIVLTKICEIEHIEDPSTITSPHRRINSPFSVKDLEQFKIGGRYFGISVRVARSLGLSNPNVSHVIHGQKISKRVLDAVRTEMARVDAEIAAKRGVQ